MDLLLQLQQDVCDKLNSEGAFEYLAVATLRRQVTGREIERRVAHLTGKNGRKGCGLTVRMPSIQGLQPNVAPAQGEVVVAVDVVEIPELNFNAGGDAGDGGGGGAGGAGGAAPVCHRGENSSLPG
jgi:hypothetical protein